MVMQRKDDRQFVDGELKVARKQLSLLGTSTDAEFCSKKSWMDLGGSAEAASYFQAVDEAPKILYASDALLNNVIQSLKAGIFNLSMQEEDLSQEGSDIFEVPEPTVAAEETERPVPALLRIRRPGLIVPGAIFVKRIPYLRTEVPRPDDHPNAALARTLGIRHVSNVQDNLSAMQDLHDQKYHEIMELRSEIQELHRSLAEAEAKYAQMEREATNAPEAESSAPPTGEIIVLALQLLPAYRQGAAATLGSPRTPRHPTNFGGSVTVDYVNDGERKVMSRYPVDKWTSTKRAAVAKKRQQRQQAASTVPLAPNLKDSTIAVDENSFWAKATT
eukprot:s6_g27.t1